MKRTNEQNALFQIWAREVADHTRLTPDMVKALVLAKLGNTAELYGTTVVMPSSAYKCAEPDLTPKDRRLGMIPFSELLDRMVAWAAMDLSLILISDNEEKLV